MLNQTEREQIVASAINWRSSFGVWWSSDLWPIHEAMARAREIEALNYGSLFFGESIGKEAISQAAVLLSGTSHLVVGTGIANAHARDPMAAEAAARTLSAAYPNRFVLGLGVGHRELVERRGSGYAKPLTMMTDYLAAMDRMDSRIEPRAPSPVRLLAALGPKMVTLAREATDGVHLYLVTPQQTADVRANLGAQSLLVAEHGVVLTDRREEGLRRARRHLSRYLPRPNYQHSFQRQGFTEADFADGGSEQLVDALVAIGDPETTASRLREQLRAGADHVVVQIIGEDDAADPVPDLQRLAPQLC